MKRNIITGIALAATVAAGFAVGQHTAPVPESCLTALDNAEATMGLNGEALWIAGEAIESAVMWDADALTAHTDDLNWINAQLDGIDYRTHAQECRAN